MRVGFIGLGKMGRPMALNARGYGDADGAALGRVCAEDAGLRRFA